MIAKKFLIRVSGPIAVGESYYAIWKVNKLHYNIGIMIRVMNHSRVHRKLVAQCIQWAPIKLSNRTTRRGNSWITHRIESDKMSIDQL